MIKIKIMEVITERQKQILSAIIDEYVNSAQPVGSEFLAKKYNFGVSAPTVRNEMQGLAKKGFLCQPHTSAGRVPTDKGYRFFVDELLTFGNIAGEDNLNFIEDIGRIEKSDNYLKFIQKITKNLAENSCGLAMSYFAKEGMIWKEGWEEIFQEPEFEKADFRLQFVKVVENLEKEIENFLGEDFSFPKIYIGKENPFPQCEDFSIIINSCCFPGNSAGFLAILGPKRMSYRKNIGLINSLVKLLENF